MGRRLRRRRGRGVGNANMSTVDMLGSCQASILVGWVLRDASTRCLFLPMEWQLDLDLAGLGDKWPSRNKRVTAGLDA